MKKFTLSFIFGLIGFSVIAQEVIPYSNDFNNYATEDSFLEEWKYINPDDDSGQWLFDNTSYFGDGPSNAPVYMTSSSVTGNDFLISPAISFEAGVEYTLSFDYAGLSSSFIEKFKLFIGNDTTSAAMTEELVDLDEITSDEFLTSEVTFTVSVSGTYYLGFYSYSDAGNLGLAIDNLSIDFSNNISNSDTYQFSMYPNPTSRKVNLSDVEDAVVTVYNMAGQQLFSCFNTHRLLEIDLSGFECGNYIIDVKRNNISTKRHLIVTNSKE